MANVINETTIHQIATLEQAEAYFASLNRRIETVQKEEKEASLISNSTNHSSENSVVAAQISLQRLYILQDLLVYRFPALLEA